MIKLKEKSMGYGCHTGKGERPVALHGDNLAELELHFPEFLPCMVLGKGKENSARDLEDGSEAVALFSVFTVSVRSGAVTSLAWAAAGPTTAAARYPWGTAGPAATPDPVGSPPPVSLSSQPAVCNSMWKFSSSLECLLHHPNQWL